VLSVDPVVAAKIKLLVLDVDGVLSTAHLVLGRSGEELKQFSVHDGVAIKFAQHAGIEVAFLSARTSEIVLHRAKMLDVREVRQGEHDKLGWIDKLIAERGIGRDAVAYVGDDLVDIAPIEAVALGVAVGDACEDVKKVADVVATKHGGHGAIREVVEGILRARGEWKSTVRDYIETH